MYYLFNHQGQYIGTCDFEPNFEDLTSRGEQAVASDFNFVNPVLIDGEIIERGEQPSPYHKWINGKWQISAEAQAMLFTEKFEQFKKRLIQQIADKTDRLKAQVLEGYPQAEIDSFYRQEKEALAWKLDNTASTEMLSAIAKARGVELPLLVEKVLEKANAVSVVMGGIIGTRQGFEDRILSAKTLAELTTCEQDIEQWQLPNR